MSLSCSSSRSLRIDQDPFVLTGEVMHQRLIPKKNGFTYPIYYLGLPLEKISHLHETKTLSVDQFACTSFYRKDHGDRKDQTDLQKWALQLLKSHDLDEKIAKITLISMPRILGYVFNPVSFWLCFDEYHQLRAIIYEVNNTYGESHSYICAHDNGAMIDGEDWIVTTKEFHVSPFLPREGHYKFRVTHDRQSLEIWIDFYNKDDERTLSTSLKGKLKPLTAPALTNAFWRMPFVTIKAITLIHWQALKLKAKGLKFFSLPKQKNKRVSRSTTLPKIKL